MFQSASPPGEPYSVMDLDVPEMMTKFMESHDDPDMVSEVRSL
jgi:hypothetical protein